VQYLEFIKGLQLELEVGDLEEARGHYLNSLTITQMMNHSIRKQTLLRLLTINKKLELSNSICRTLI